MSCACYVSLMAAFRRGATVWPISPILVVWMIAIKTNKGENYDHKLNNSYSILPRTDLKTATRWRLIVFIKTYQSLIYTPSQRYSYTLVHETRPALEVNCLLRTSCQENKKSEDKMNVSRNHIVEKICIFIHQINSLFCKVILVKKDKLNLTNNNKCLISKKLLICNIAR